MRKELPLRPLRMVMGTSHYNREGASARVVWSSGKVDAPDSESFAIALFSRVPLAGALAGCPIILC